MKTLTTLLVYFNFALIVVLGAFLSKTFTGIENDFTRCDAPLHAER